MRIMSEQLPHISLTRKIDLNKKFIRVGILFYFYDIDDELNFLFGIDSNHWELTDLGGIRGNNEDFLDAAIREAYEESMGIIDMRNDKKDIYDNSIIVYNKDIAIIFKQVIITDLHSLIILHRKKYLDGIKKRLDKKFLENSFLIWIKASDVIKLVNNCHTI